MSKGYILDYASGATGYGWRQECKRLSEAEDFINEMRYEKMARVTLWDKELGEYIFWKDILTFKPEIDKLHCIGRDFRTKTRKWKEEAR